MLRQATQNEVAPAGCGTQPPEVKWLLEVSSNEEKTIVIESRFNGPPGSANGGYACGTVANLLGDGPAEVALRAPPPLDQPLEVRRTARTVSLHDGETLIAEGRQLDALQLEVKGSVDAGSGAAASANYPWYDEHFFPTCFVCGPKRAERDGLGIFTGRVEGTELFASTWTPAEELADSDGKVRSEIVWAALDCPTAIAALTNGETVPGMLGTLAASIDGPLLAGEPHTISTWALGVDGRKRSAAAAIAGPDGAIKARSQALWIELRR